jgi:outer membrane lipoprotein-sorting protein
MTLALMIATTAAARGETLEAIEKKLIASAEKVTSMSATQIMKSQFDTGGGKMTNDSNGTFEFVRKSGKLMFRAESKNVSVMNVSGQTMRNETRSLTVGDGQFVWSQTDTGEQKMVTKSKMPKEASNLISKGYFDNLRRDNDIKVLPDATVDGKSTYVVEVSPKTKGPQSTTTTSYYLKDTGILVKSVTSDAAGKPMTTLTYSDIKVNTSIPADRFVFKAPPGVQVMDMTEK